MTDGFRPVFVMGCPRSGTTLLSEILNRHSAFAGTPETNFFLLTYLRKPWCTVPDELVRLFCENPRASDCGLEPAALRAALSSLSACQSDLFRVALSEFATEQGKRIPVEKTCYHLPFTPLILEWYPQAKCLCIIRDGRDVVLSLKRVGWGYRNTYLNSLQWRYAAALATKFQKQYPGKFRVIRYEDILEDPDRAISDLMGFLGESFEEQQLAASTTSSVVPKWEMPWKGQALQAVDRTNVGRWRNRATKDELRIMHAVMGRYLRQYGYEELPVAWPWRGYAVGAGLLMRCALSPHFQLLWRRLGLVRTKVNPRIVRKGRKGSSAEGAGGYLACERSRY